jgi:hypothetical protein
MLLCLGRARTQLLVAVLHVQQVAAVQGGSALGRAAMGLVTGGHA